MNTAPDSERRSRLSSIYLPFRYTEQVKRPGAKHFLRQFLLNDLALIVLAIGLTQPSDIALYLALGFALVSFYSIYELGYHENDVLGARNEVSPKLSETFDPNRDYQLVPSAYYWAVVTGMAAVWLSSGNELADLVSRGAMWAGFLVAVRLTFALYNRLYKARILLYPVLQSLKMFGFLVLGGASAAGLLVMISEVMSRSLRYAGYRLHDGHIPWRDSTFLRLVLYVTMATAMEATNRSVILFEDWRFWLIAVWLVTRVRRDKTRQAKA